MSSSLSVTQNNFSQNFPNEVPRKAAQGSIVSATIQLISGSATNMVLFAGILSVTATLIEAITRPIIQDIFPANQWIAQFVLIILPSVLVFKLAFAVAPAFVATYYATSCFALNFFAWCALNDNSYEKNVGLAFIF